MPNRDIRDRKPAAAEIMAAYFEDREDEVLDALVTAAALVARADGRIDLVEPAQTIDFLDRHDFLSIFTRAEIFGVFERRARELREPGGIAAALDGVRRQTGRPLARLVIEVSEEVAIADCRLDPREERMLEVIRMILGVRPSWAVSTDQRPGKTR